MYDLFAHFSAFAALAIPAAALNIYHASIERSEGQALYLLGVIRGEDLVIGPSWVRQIGELLYGFALLNTLAPLVAAGYFSVVGDYFGFIAAIAYYGAALLGDLASNHLGPFALTLRVSPTAETWWGYAVLGIPLVAWSIGGAGIAVIAGFASFFLSWPLVYVFRNRR